MQANLDALDERMELKVQRMQARDTSLARYLSSDTSLQIPLSSTTLHTLLAYLLP
jgi:hypothetical protein